MIKKYSIKIIIFSKSYMSSFHNILSVYNLAYMQSKFKRIDDYKQ